MYSLSMIIVEARQFPETMIHPCSNRSRLQLATGKMPFHGSEDPTVIITVSKGKRPSRPQSFDAPGMTPAVWKIAEKCWHEKAKQRPKVNTVLQYLENLGNPGMNAHSNLEGRQLTRDYSR